MEKIKDQQAEKKEKIIKIPLVVWQIFLMISITVLTSLAFSVYQVPLASAEPVSGLTNCYISESGQSSCTDVPIEECGNLVDSQGGKCEATLCNTLSECTLGCGFDTTEGICTPNTPKGLCDEPDCEWDEDPFCNINECSQGCCVLGNNVQFTTRERCNILSQREGLPSEFDSSIDTELACLNKVNALNEGACVFSLSEEGNSCTLTTLINCAENIGGTFHDGLLCTNPVLDTFCEIQDKASCLDGRDQVYFVDTCGNRANVYDSSKKTNQAYWNTIKNPSESCNSNSANINGQCGNCDYELGSICGEHRPGTDSGNMAGLTCRDLNCKDSNGENRINGESWCVYDGKIGEQTIDSGKLSADVVGSRPIREVCSNGEVQVEPCGDYRKESCVQNEKTLSNGREIDSAICRVNLWDQCIMANSDASDMGSCDSNTDCFQQCGNNPDCRIQDVNIDSGFKFKSCVPEHPPGFDLGSTTFGGNSLIEGEELCSFGSRTCVVVYKKSATGKWRCKKNCDCQNAEFTEQMNNLCTSIGDCGAYINYNEQITDGGYNIKRVGGKARAPPRFNTTDGTLEDLYEDLAEDSNTNKDDGGFFQEEGDILTLNDHGVGDPFLVGYVSGIPDPEEGGGLLGIPNPVLIAGVIATVITTIIANTIGFGAWAATNVIGVIGPLGINPIGLIIVIIIIIIISLLGIGKIKTTQISFECKPWQRPYGGNECTSCGKDGKPCTEYRCEALGTRCKLINENTGFDECISIEGEEGIPVITPWEEILNTSSYRYQNISTNGFKVRTSSGECIQAFTPLIFGVETDILAQCKYGSENLEFEDMNNDFLEGGIFLRNHTLVTVLPSVDSIIATETNPGETLNASDYEYLLDQIGDMDLHIKCTNLDGEVNDVDYRINFCVNPGPDLTPPFVTATLPPTESNVRFDSTEQDVFVYISEPASCKWGSTKPSGNTLSDFNSLGNNLECPQDADGVTLLGYPCNATLPITQNNNDYHILCRDQPWLAENTSRNIGSIFTYNLQKTQTPLSIDSILPEGTIFAGTEPITIELEVKTNGGVNNGISRCEYSLNGGGFIDFFETGLSSNHRQILNQMLEGTHIVNVKCEDSIGNPAVDQGEFTLELDTDFPFVTRVFSSGGDISVETNEQATCVFRNDSTSSCGFSFENSTQMESFGNIHSTNWVEDQTYYIKCKDIWSNQPGQCSIVVKPYNN